MIGVGQERKVELELVGELLADAEYRGLGSFLNFGRLSRKSQAESPAD
jgi:hypothetical protein